MPQTENVPEENGVDQTISQGQAIEQPQSQNMEVHHHPSRKTGEKKGLKEYLLEGLMIFIAVSMGFIAENIPIYKF